MPNRFVPAVMQDGEKPLWGIYDHHIGAFCTMPDSDSEHPNLLPLEWHSRDGAAAWLHRCYTAWQLGRVPAPDDWEPYVAAQRPWLTYRSHEHLRPWRP
jgi:hypothetical protein